MSTYPPPGSPHPGPGRRIDEAIDRIEAELRQAVAYVNDNVVPEVRRESIFAMRRLAETLHKLADRIETTSPPQKDSSSKAPSPKDPSEGSRS